MVASNADPDTLTFDQAMTDTANLEAWKTAAAKEIAQLEARNTWTEVPTTQAATKILPGTWVFRIKRSPDGTILKYKARYCVRGDLQGFVPDTYAPVVSWTTIRLFLACTFQKKWVTATIDFSNAFIQAPLPDPVWIHAPRGFHSAKPNMCLRLDKSLYGLAQAPRLWHDHLFKALVELGFKAANEDSCLLFRDNIMIVAYVDDLGIAGPTQKAIDTLIQELEKRQFTLTKEGSFTEFLGIKFEQVGSNLRMTQRGLIKKILDAAGMADCRGNHTPAAPEALGKDPNGQPHDEEWSYPSIVGMLLYLSSNTRPDIAFAVSQVARFTRAPTKKHATAVKTILRYLKKTQDQGTNVKLTDAPTLDCYVDADFAGLFRQDPDTDKTSACSRSGIIVSYGGFPVVWRTFLQKEVCLSTLEAEYSALSEAMRILLPIQRLLNEMCEEIKLPLTNGQPHIISQVFEDNNGALQLAVTQKLTSRTKYFHVKWHFFWDKVKQQIVRPMRVDTNEQKADYLTKGLTRQKFEHGRHLNQGW